MSAGRRQVMVVVRDTSKAHPSFAKGGYIPLHQGATAYRNADFVVADPAEILEWCRNMDCTIVALENEDSTTRRFVVTLLDEQVFAQFEESFRR